MPYDHFIKGAVGFSRSDTWISREIRRLTHSPWSHTFLVTSENPRLILEADWRDVWIAPPEKTLKRSEFILLRPPKSVLKKIDHALELVDQLVRRKYGYLQLAGFLVKLLSEKFGYEMANPFTEGVVCSELVGQYLECLGLEGMPSNVDPNDLTPADVFAYANRGGFKKV